MGEDFPQAFGQYTLHELIGRGGMAEIYRATMPGIGGFEKTVAIKKILPHLAEDDEFTSMLIDEARIIESLDHSNIAQVFDLGKREGTYYIAMEYIHGVDLAEMIEELEEHGQYIPLPHVIHITSSICAGLHFAHSKTDDQGNPLNVIHRDISPHNIRLSFAGEVKIIDFGVAKAADREAHTKMGVIKGKLLYMAPEQAKAENLDGRADLFAAGLCAYKMLTGELPFEGENEFQVYNNILQKDIVPPKRFRPEIPDELDRIVMKLLERDRDQRYQEGYEAKQDLDRLLHQVAPGYTVNRLSQFVEENFSHLVQQKAEPDQQTVTSNPSDVAPSTPTRQNPGTGQRGADQLQTNIDDSNPVQQPVPASSQADTQSATAPARPDRLDGNEGAPPPDGEPGKQRTETSSNETTGQFQQPQTVGERDGSGLPRVVYAIVALVLAISGMIAYALTASDLGPNPSPNPPKQGGTPPDDEDEGVSGMIRVHIESEPADAKILRKGEIVGRTPIKFVLPRSKEAIQLTLAKAGFGDETIELVPMEDFETNITLSATEGGDAGPSPDAGSADRDDEAGAEKKDDKETADDAEREEAEASGSDESAGGSATAEKDDGADGSRSGGGGSSDDSDDSDDGSGGIGSAFDRQAGGSGSAGGGGGDDPSNGTNDEGGGSESESSDEDPPPSEDDDEIIDPFAE